MKTHFRILLLFLLFTIINCKLCNENESVTNPDGSDDCTQTEYGQYVKCIRSRMKRSLDCESSEDECNGCDCNYCETHDCQSSCSNCCSRNACTTAHCCHKTCSMQCKSTSCRKSCRKDCVDKVNEKEKVIVQHDSNVGHNITTVIHLLNNINNTNLIDIPVTVNNTNLNNITLDGGNIAASISGGAIGGGGITGSQNQCCHLIGPRQCVYIPEAPYSKCFHVRSKHCGNVCHSSTVHVQKHEICENLNEAHQQPSCREEVIYIPQPRPRCYHQQKWPYVSCGMLEAECGGCYAHHSTKSAYSGGCPNACFDDGYDAGPMYRQGPYYRPGYAPVPSCHQIGTCGQGGYGYQSGDGSYGYPLPTGYPGPGYFPYGGAYPSESYGSNFKNMQPGGYPLPGLQQPDNYPSSEFVQPGGYPIEGLQQQQQQQPPLAELYASKNRRSTERNLKDADDRDDLPPKLVSLEAKIEEKAFPE